MRERELEDELRRMRNHALRLEADNRYFEERLAQATALLEWAFKCVGNNPEFSEAVQEFLEGAVQ